MKSSIDKIRAFFYPNTGTWSLSFNSKIFFGFYLKVNLFYYLCSILILGNGGVKKTQTYDEDDELRGFVVTLQNFDKLIKQGVKDGTITISENEINTDNTFDI